MCFFFSSRRRHTRLQGDWSSDVCSSDLRGTQAALRKRARRPARLAGAGQFAAGARDRSSDAALAGRRGAHRRAKIGRASCKGKRVERGGRRVNKKKTRAECKWDGGDGGE